MEYSAHIKGIMHSPPKKKGTQLPKLGGGIPPTSNPTPTSSLQPSNLPKTPTPSQNSDEMEIKFNQIRAEMNHQRECNIHFDACISSLELRTQSIDSKIDMVLNRFAPPDSPTYKIQKNMPSQLSDVLLYPRRNSAFHTDTQGVMEP